MINFMRKKHYLAYILTLLAFTLPLSQVAVASTVLTTNAILAEARANVPQMTIAEIIKRQNAGEEIIFVDVRTDEEVAKGKIKGAIHLRRDILEFQVDPTFAGGKYYPAALKNPNNALIVVYCSESGRSPLAAQTMQKMGVKNIVNMTDGGYPDYKKAGGEVEE